MQGVKMKEFPKLSNICIDSIIVNFDILMIEHLTGTSIPKRHFEHLQRKYSKVIFQKFKFNSDFWIYYKFVLNKFLKEIDLFDFYGWVSEDVLKHLSTIGYTITKLHIEMELHSNHALMHLLQRIPNVQFIALNVFISAHHGYQVFRTIGDHCKKLQALDFVFYSNVTDEAIRALCPDEGKNEVLKHLNIRNTPVTSQGIWFILEHFPNIETIHHNNMGEAVHCIYVSKSMKSRPASMRKYKLTQLDIDGKKCQSVDEFISCNILCPGITKLSVNNIQFQTQIDGCTQFAHLQNVDLGLVMFSLVDLSPFFEASGNNLQAFSLQYGKISAKMLIKCCPKLKSLILQETHFNPIEQSENSEFGYTFQYLEKLIFINFTFDTDEDKSSANLILSASPNLEYLKFYSISWLSASFVKSIVSHRCMSYIRSIVISSENISELNLAMLVLATPNLEKLIYLRHTPENKENLVSNFLELLPHLSECPFEIQLSDDTKYDLFQVFDWDRQDRYNHNIFDIYKGMPFN